ncbi:hypothetical protein HEK616_02090 [Streptomyces nigrescens]|uniref:DUF397 domain-containing protein n=2 Tax=Streptomyces TaxID=1883 RepID=A0ABM7ZK62_STRNI|nr:DUF397 domain-containing protein [Streptomyces nigrescens]MEE4424748.1 DUF397 domain-containing protein [Streptomyces sp. DSM 41528]BDM66722.1 hypothetical protein HEK616_02090 [Streptomyces nigrescens]
MSREIKWQKSSFSSGNSEQCLETARDSGEILLRESDDPHVIVRTTPEKLAAFILGVKNGEFDHFVN